MVQKTNEEKHADEILKRLLDSFPCEECDRFKKFERELNHAKATSGGYGNFDSKVENIVRHTHSKFVNHIEEKHMPSKEEWEILNK